MTLARRAPLSFVCVAGVAAASIAGGDVARAADTDDAGTVAAQFFRAGRAAYDRNEYRAAALAFLEAYRRLPRGAAIYNAGRAWEAAGEPALAADAFARALERGDLSTDDQAYAREHLAALEPSLAVVDVSGTRGAAVTEQGVPRGVVPVTLHVRPGAHELRVRSADGREIVRDVEVARAGEHASVVASFPAPPAPAPQRATPAAVDDPGARARRTLGWITLATAAAATAFGVFAYVRFTDARSSFEQGGSHDGALHDDAQRWRSVTYAAWAGAAALAVVGTVVVLTASPRRGGASGVGAGAGTLELRATAGGLAVTLQR